MAKAVPTQTGARQPAPQQQQGQSAPVVQQSASTATAAKPQIRDWASL